MRNSDAALGTVIKASCLQGAGTLGFARFFYHPGLLGSCGVDRECGGLPQLHRKRRKQARGEEVLRQREETRWAMKTSIRRPAPCPQSSLPPHKDVRPGSAASSLPHVMERKASLCRQWGFDNLLRWTRSGFHGPFPCRSWNRPAPCTFGRNCGSLEGMSMCLFTSSHNSCVET